MIEFLLRRPVAVIMTTIAFLVLGGAASLKLPVSLMPDIDIPEITVHYIQENASVNEVENSVTGRLRNQLQQIPHLASIQSESKEGSGLISLKFDYGTSINYAFIEVNQKVDAVMGSLPKEMPRPTIIKASTSDIPVFYINANLKEPPSDERFLQFSEFAEVVLKKRLEQLPDVAMVDLSGIYQPEMYILPDEAKLRSLNITQDHLKTAIDNNNRVAGSLAIRDGYYQYSINFTSQLMSVEDVENVYLNIEGRLMKVKDIAKVGIRPRDKRGLYVNDGKQSLSMAVIKQSNARMSEMKEKVSEMLAQFEKEYPEIEFSVSRDQAVLLNYSIDNLWQSLITGIFLAIFVMLFFLRDARSPLIIAISIPVSLIISILFFQLAGLTINTISLAGLILGVGMMVDNSIIVIDNINQWRERGYALMDACVKATNEVIRPLLSSVLTTCAVFIPLVFLGGISGALFYDQAMAVTIGLFVSLFVSITIVPVIFHMLLKRNRDGKISALIRKISIKNLDKYYTYGYEYVFHHRKKVIFTVLALSFMGAIAGTCIVTERMPKLEIEEMILKIDWNSSIHIDENQQRVNDIIGRFKDDSQELSCYIGEKQFLLNQDDNQNTNEAEIYIRAEGNKRLTTLINHIRTHVRETWPEAKIEFKNVENLFEQLFKDEDARLIVYLAGGSKREVPEINQVNRFIDRMTATHPGLQLNKPSSTERLVIHLLPDRLALYKINQGALIATLEKNISKTNISRVNTGSRYIPIVITENERNIREILNTTTVRNSDGQYIPVAALTDVSTDYDYKSIFGRKEGTVVPINIYETGNHEKEIMLDFKTETAKEDLSVYFGGSYFSGTETFWEMLMIITIALLMLYFILAAQFESLSLPLIVLIEIPIDVALTLLVLITCGVTLNLMSMIGIIVMCGVVINDSILKIDTIIRLQKDEGLPLLEAIHEGGVRRLKPILMTSLTSIFSVLPFMWGNDIGSQLQRPLAITMICGMSFGTMVSFYFVPLCYYYLRRGKEKK